tara:strand:- start:1394 stop:1600 length:207 start_codon:yes stop_codon:yes gene_type:complete
MENLKRIAEAMELELRKGGQGYVIYNRNHVRIDNVGSLESVAVRLAHYVSIRQSNHNAYKAIFRQGRI